MTERALKVEHYEFGSMTVGGRTYNRDVIIWPEGVDDTWWRAKGHSLCKDDLEPVLQNKPDVLIIGTGAQGMMEVPAEIIRYVMSRCDEVHVERTGRAVELYNRLTGSSKRVVAAFHLTC